MKEPTPEQLISLFNTLDTAAWAWHVRDEIRLKTITINYKDAIDNLMKEWEEFKAFFEEPEDNLKFMKARKKKE